MNRCLLRTAAAAALAACPFCLAAQTPEEPSAYSVSVRNLSGPPFVTTASRLGSQVVVDITGDPSGSGDPAQGTHQRTLLNLETKIRLAWDRVDGSVPCVRSNFTSEDRHRDDLEDPFLGASLPSAKSSRQIGTETIHGIATRILETTDDPDAALKMWVDPRTGLVMKLAIVSRPEGLERALWEVTQVSFEAPSVSLFAVPPQCNPFPILPQTGAAPVGWPAPSGSLGTYAWNGLVGPPTGESCTVLFRVVGPDAPRPMTGPFQVAMDLAAGADPLPRYSALLDKQGRATLSGGHLHEIAPEGSSGLYRIENAPGVFVLDVEFGWRGSAAARIYRHCFAPQTVLEYVASPEALHLGGIWRWVKPGMYPSDPR